MQGAEDIPAVLRTWWFWPVLVAAAVVVIAGAVIVWRSTRVRRRATYPLSAANSMDASTYPGYSGYPSRAADEGSLLNYDRPSVVPSTLSAPNMSGRRNILPALSAHAEVCSSQRGDDHEF